VAQDAKLQTMETQLAYIFTGVVVVDDGGVVVCAAVVLHATCMFFCF
jgi:hypothetical protein